jgi:hypothetical protein
LNTAPPIVGTETYVSFAVANAVADDRLNAQAWQTIVAQYVATQAAEAAANDTEPTPLSEAIPAECRQALTTAAATLSRMPWASDLALPLAAENIPPALTTACAELAFYLLTAESRRRRNVQMSMVGQAMETYFAEVADELPKHVRRLVEPFLRVRSTYSAELVP